MIVETVFVLTILGCGNDASACDFVAEPQGAYESKLACEEAMHNVLPRFEDAAYPVLTGNCAQRPNVVQVADLKTPPAPIEPNTFEKLRANADLIEFDPIGQTKALIIRVSDATKNAFGKLQDVVRGE